MDGQEEVVLHEIRVDKTVPDTRGFRGKLRIIYAGISANAWLSPAGIQQQRRAASSFNLLSASLQEDVKSSIHHRAVSANGIMGRRHFELEKQELGKNDILFGVQLGRKIGTTTYRPMSLKEDEFKTEQITPRKNCFEQTNASKKDSKRPMTGIGNFRNKRPVTSVSCPSRGTVPRDLPDLCITQMLGITPETSRSDTVENSVEVSKLSPTVTVGMADLRKRMKVLDDDSVRFRSVGSMRRAFNARTRSAPIPKEALKNMADDGSDVIDTYALSMRKSRSSPSVAESYQHQSYRGPTLKPLSYNEKQDFNCPKGCKGCFKACLASDDYFERVKTREFAPKNTSVYRKRVSYRLRPALRMAFLEQLVISKDKSRTVETCGGKNDKASSTVEEERKDLYCSVVD